ncbi:MAG: hypothetical protein RR275_04195 [Lachnospiraceae bacterium]
MAEAIKSFLHFSVPDEGLLTDYESWMPDFMKGLANGIDKSKRLVSDAVSGASSIGRSGDIVIPVYLGGTMLDEVIVNAQQRANLRSGGRFWWRNRGWNHAERCSETWCV